MSNGWLTKHRFAAGLLLFAVMAALGGVLAPTWLSGEGGFLARAQQPDPALVRQIAPRVIAKPALPVVVEPPAVGEVLKSGVLIVVSKATQQMYVFKDGQHWRTTPVSTGKRGKATPSGVFPILQKKVFHRSNIYSNAPMPYMQRLTWSGIALHAGHLPGYPASHGCIRMPREFARSLYNLTRANTTTVVVADAPLKTVDLAQRYALNVKRPRASTPVRPDEQAATAFASNDPPRSPKPTIAPVAVIPAGRSQTIQLAAAATPVEAEAHWNRLVSARPDLERFEMAVIPALVGSRRVYRLRASAPDAFATCSALKSVGIDCFNVS